MKHLSLDFFLRSQNNILKMEIKSQAIAKRVDEYDMMKCMAILLVVIGHTACPKILHNMCYSIHIPLFFLISGCTIRGGINSIP